jgi:hypothetical protein
VSQHPPDDVAAAHDATSIWGEFIGELERAYRPFGRASRDVRAAAMRVARHMARAQVAPDDIRRELSRAVRAQARLATFDDDRHESEGRGYETFLADVLRTVIEVRSSTPRPGIAQSRTIGDGRTNA